VPHRSEKKSHRLRDFIILMLAATAGFWVALRSSPPSATAPSGSNAAAVPAQAPQATALNPPPPTLHCEAAFPPNGSITLFPENGAPPTGPNDPEITLQNDHAHPLLLILAAPQTAIPVMSVLIHARQNASVRIPPGQYDMLFGVGDSWCNPRNGFSDGHILKFGKPLVVQMDRPMQLTMQSSGAGMEDFQLFVKVAHPETEIPPPTFTGDGSMEVQRHPNGHFYVPGSVVGVPVTFMVDTGASVTSISDDIARQAGIRNCKEVPVQTANGTTTGCIALVPRMTLGNFVMENITVAVMPNMEVNLLGANVLRNFQVHQDGSVMLIGRR
jgi:clan AA aspartic protease (TIGR02281 family)